MAPPAKHGSSRPNAVPVSDGNPLATSAATADCSPTNDAAGPERDEQSAAKPQRPRPLSLPARIEPPATDPTKIENAMPQAAVEHDRRSAAIDTLEGPEPDRDRADSAKHAGCPLSEHEARDRGSATPTVQRSAAALRIATSPHASVDPIA